MQEIKFETDMIRLKDLLKITNIVSSGGVAKSIIKEEGVILNGEKCFIPGKQLHKNDQVVFDQYIIKIV